MPVNRPGYSRVLPRLMDERADLIAWRQEDLRAGRLHLCWRADEAIVKLDKRIARLAEREYDRLIGWRGHAS